MLGRGTSSRSKGEDPQRTITFENVLFWRHSFLPRRRKILMKANRPATGSPVIPWPVNYHPSMTPFVAPTAEATPNYPRRFPIRKRPSFVFYSLPELRRSRVFRCRIFLLEPVLVDPAEETTARKKSPEVGKRESRLDLWSIKTLRG